MNKVANVKSLGAWVKSQYGFAVFIGLMMVFRSACADWNYVPSSSMNPTLVQGDRVVVNKLAYRLRLPFTLVELVRWGTPQRGDVITFDAPKDNLNLIKRVIAVEGDVVDMQSNELHINGAAVDRELVAAVRTLPTEQGPQDVQVWSERSGDVRIETVTMQDRNWFRDMPPITVPAGTVMVMGDSRDNSNDSRFIGFIDVGRVTGQAVRVALSHDPANFYMPRSGRWWLPLHL